MPGSRRILQPGRSGGARVIQTGGPAPPPATGGGRGAAPAAPGHGGIAPGQGGIIPALGVVVAAVGGGKGPPPAPSDDAVKLFDQTLSGAAASIDTGANAIPAGYTAIIVYLTARSTDAGVSGSVNVRVNGDSGARYDLRYAGTSTGDAPGATSWAFGVHGAGGAASYPSVGVFVFPAYADTTFFKVGTFADVLGDTSTAVNAAALNMVVGWRSTAAINQFSVTSAAATLVAGTRLTIYGLS